MKEMYLTLPEPLKKQIIAHLTMSFTALCFFFMIMVFCREFILAAPCLIFGVFVAIKSIHLFLNCISGNYLEINGICSKVEITGFRKRIKSISVAAENKTLKIPAQFLIKKPQKGNQVTLYLSKKAKLYYSEGSYIANDIYALHIH